MKKIYLISFYILAFISNIKNMENLTVTPLNKEGDNSSIKMLTTRNDITCPESTNPAVKDLISYEDLANHEFQYLLNYVYFSHLELKYKIQTNACSSPENQNKYSRIKKMFLFLINLQQSKNVIEMIKKIHEREKEQKLTSSQFYKFVYLELERVVYKKKVPVQFQTIMVNEDGIIEENKRIAGLPDIL